MANEIKKLICELYIQGMSAREIHEELNLNISQRTVGRLIQEKGLSRPNGGSKHKYPNLMGKIIELYKEGNSSAVLSRRYGIKSATIRKWVRDYGISRGCTGLKGSENPEWKNGSTVWKLRLKKKYKKWRLLVLERDGFKCCSCGNTGGILHVHHIMSFTEFPLLGTDVENGITLCKDCHFFLHGKTKKRRA